MKGIKLFLLIILSIVLVMCLFACGETPSSSDSGNGSQTQQDDKDPEVSELNQYINMGLNTLDEVVNPTIVKITDDGLKASVQGYYTTERNYISGITDLEEAKNVVAKVVQDTKDFVKNTLKPLVIEKVNGVVNPLINAITYQTLKTSVQTYYNTEMAKISAIEELSQVPDVFKEIIDDTKKYIKDETLKIVAELKNDALEELDPYLTALIAKIPTNSLKEDVQDFYTEEKKKLEAVDTIEGVVPCVNEIKDDLVSFALTEIKKAGIDKLDEIVNPVLEKITNTDLKNSLQTYYNTEKKYIDDIKDIDTAKDVLTKIASDTGSFVTTTFKPLVINKINGVVNPLIEAITYKSLKTSVQTYYDTEMEKVSKIDSLDSAADTFSEIVEDTKKYIKDETLKIVTELKNDALEELDPYVTTLIGKIPYNTLKTDVQAFYTEEKKKLEAVDTIEGVSPCITEIKDDLEVFALTEIKKIAVDELDEVITAGLNKLPNQKLKDDLTTFKNTELAKLNAVTSVENVPTTLETVLTETATYIKSLLIDIVKGYLTKLSAVETATAYDYLPEAMTPMYANNIVNSTDIAYDFTTNTSISSINRAGYGEQWQMVIENINQSVAMAKVFNVAQTALGSAATLVDAYITNSYADTMDYEFSGSNFTGVFSFVDSKLVFKFKLTTTINLPVIGSVSPDIVMEYDLTEEARSIYISLGDVYKVLYVITESGYEMATTYGITVGGKEVSRTSLLTIDVTRTGTVGHIYEYTSYQGSDKIKACVDFYVVGDYVSVVGNKASGMVGFSGYITELYLKNEGRLIGYEVMEDLTILGVTGTYNTLWFNMWDIQGITSIKVTEKTDANKSDKSTVDVYLNGSTTLLSPTYNYKSILKTSRKYDVELRKRYYYTYDDTNQSYVCNEVEVPMFFIQEGDNFNSFTTDFSKDNKMTVSVSLSSTYLNKILSDYDTLIDVFKTNKENMNSEQIIAYLSKYEEQE